MTIERIEVLETTVYSHSRRLDDHAKLHARHIASDGEHAKILSANTASIAALEENTKVTTHLTEVMANLIEALAWVSKISRLILWIAAGATAVFLAAKFAVAKVMGWL
jgi:hypothetical protein